MDEMKRTTREMRAVEYAKQKVDVREYTFKNLSHEKKCYVNSELGGKMV